ncbi:MAG: multifunctional CCA addition/repair protein [Xanthomonadaceae bacterium]|nr:multifunctional CCA addition/repair protein [Xanthomonadaceae bacterium]
MAQEFKVYLVGGAVRDALLGHPFHEHDWVVVGATPEMMLEKGFKQVGKDFPVFLHPKTGEEYALARSERKTAKGYHGFEIDASPNTTLEEDLLRRDLTINAMAQDETGNLFDPYHGADDLNNRILRHVSDAFIEDPVRVLRLARFYARYQPYGFTVADETKALVKTMIDSGELDALVPERIWQELVKALSEDQPQAFFYCLKELGALETLFPEVHALFGIPQTAKYHPEIDSGIHVMMALEQIAKITDDLPTRYAVLCHDFGKAVTPTDELPSHKMHEIRGVPITRAFSERLRVPNEYRDIALKVTEHHLIMHQLLNVRPKTILKLILNLDGFRRPINVERFINACLADARGRLGLETREYPQKNYLQTIFNALQSLPINEAIQSCEPKEIPLVIERLRLQRISEMIKSYTPS